MNELRKQLESQLSDILLQESACITQKERIQLEREKALLIEQIRFLQSKRFEGQ